jgi:hypothetical protein
MAVRGHSRSCQFTSGADRYQQRCHNPPGAGCTVTWTRTCLGVRLTRLGRWQDTVAPSEEAAAIRRELARASPGADLPGVALSLSHLGALLPKLGRHQDAVAPTKEALAIRCKLAQSSPVRLPVLRAKLVRIR